jgi:Rhodanese-related sulfurtransferase
MHRILVKSMAVVTALLAFSASASAESAMSDEERILRHTAAALKDMPFLSAGEVHDIVQNNDTDFMIVSLQSEEEYRAGHVPGSTRIAVDMSGPFAAAPELPSDKTLILVSSNGQAACKAAVFLRQSGYRAAPMLLGMNAYNRAYAGAGAYAGDAGGAISTQDVPFTPQPAAPTYSAKNERDLIGERTLAYAQSDRPFTITASDLMNLMGKEDIVIISMQSAEDYAAGHIPGAINIPGPRFIAGDERLLALPKTKEIIVTCYIGHYSGMGALILNQMGYKARSLEWGLAGWNRHALGNHIGETLAKDAGFAVETTP